MTPLGLLALKSGMEHLVENENPSGIYYFGEKSVFANWLLNHPFLIAVVLSVVGCLIVIDDKVMLSRVIIAFLPLVFGMAFLVRYLCKDLCFAVEIDTVHQIIRLFQCYNKGVVEAPLGEVEFCFDKSFGCYYIGKKFTIMNEYMYKILSILPSEKSVKFADNIYSRFVKKQFDKWKIRTQM